MERFMFLDSCETKWILIIFIKLMNEKTIKNTIHRLCEVGYRDKGDGWMQWNSTELNYEIYFHFIIHPSSIFYKTIR